MNMTKQLEILLVDDHMMVRDGLSLMLESQTEKFEFTIHEADSAEEAVLMTEAHDYDVIIMDYNLPRMSGAEATRSILRAKPLTKVIALSNSDEYANVNHMMTCGAKGFILKNIGPQELIKAIDTVLNDEFYYSNEVAIKLISHKEPDQDKNAFAPKTKFIPKNKDIFSRRELQVLELIIQGLTNEQIAVRLNLRKRTIDSHRQHMLDKVNVSNTAELLMFAMENNLIKKISPSGSSL